MFNDKFGINGLVIAPPSLGRISIGGVVEKNGKRLPQKDDQITITSNVQVKREWKKHPLDEKLRRIVVAKEKGVEPDKVQNLDLAGAKLRSIPVKVMFDDPNLNLSAQYTAFEKGGRVICRGNGTKALRVDPLKGKVDEVGCNPDSCPVAEEYHCKPYTRFNVQIDGQDDELGVFTFRTVGRNSLQALRGKLNYLYGLTNGKVAGMPLDLVIRADSSQQSMWTTYYYLDLVIRKGFSLVQAIKEAHIFHQEWEDYGVSRDAFEEQARQGIANGMFEDSAEDLSSILEEFFPEHSDTGPTQVDELRKALDAESQTLDTGNVTQQEPALVNAD